MNVTVIGTGYVGLTTGASLAYLGHEVTCVDVDEKKVEQLSQGIMPFYEPGMKELLQSHPERIHFTSSYWEAVMGADVIFFAVGTPAQSDGSPNLTYLFSAVEETVGYLRMKEKSTVLINKSTVPVGTGDKIAQKVKEASLETTVRVASNPEFLRQARAIQDTFYPDRIVVGGDEVSDAILSQLYSGVLNQSFAAPAYAPRPAGYTSPEYILVDRRSAELAKYAANAFLAMKISFINEIANVCDRVGADVKQVAGIIGKDVRIGSSFLQAGIGYGGSCFPKDTRALQYIADTSGYDFKLLSAVIEVNHSQKYIMLQKLREQLGELAGKQIAVLGLSFKPGTDDLREAPSIPIILELLAEKADVRVHDPVAMNKARSLLPDRVHFAEQIKEALRNADAALLVTEWPEYISLSAEEIRSLMRRPVFIDGRNAMAASDFENADMDYLGIGTRNKKKYEHV
ncbi:UDP-glucose/GDP-mannose dehydrogenase family protein [Paenibacillus filicis]|uniref:UDP-glucose 6-dehydrogenase n=1 Tax=Paenibacillus gyeongsangnamensis TaxID=3388067 RepID=A0ABT4QI28_9BACL|nr:UDP-glucose/GDP-mannose dehydrogenase family protein [Paenibacillus filicis]MCZ8516478.1 UDP-glucose/GDP-mannose dehydrogenase family protein [Paenibacillus filicis]